MFKKGDCCFVGRGELFGSLAQTECGYGYQYGYNYGGLEQEATYVGRSFGNVTDFSLEPQFSLIQNVKRTGLLQGADCAGYDLNGINFSMNLTCFNFDNLSMMLYGKQEPIDCPVETKNICVSAPCDGFKCGGLISIKGNFDKNTFVVVRTDTSQTLELGIDYIVTDAGIKLLKDILVNPLILDITYNTLSSNFECIQPFIDKPKPMRLTFEVVNLVDCTSCYTFTIHKAIISPLASLDLIGNSIQEFTLQGTLLPDENITDTDKYSQYFELCKRTKEDV